MNEVVTAPSSQVQSVEDVQNISKLGIDFFLAGQSTYEAIEDTAKRIPEKTAITHILNGDCYNPEQLPFKSKLTHWAVKTLTGNTYATPIHSITYRELLSGINKTANLLHALNVGPNDVVSILMPNFIETHYALWGAEATGIANPINPLLEPDIIQEIMTAANSKVLIALGPVPGTDIWEKVLEIKDKIPSLEKVLVVFGKDEPKKNVLSFDKNIARQDGTRLASGRKIHPSEPASMFHTGGTTGVPKLAVHSHRNELSNAAMLSAISPLDSKDKVLVGLPLFHVNAAIGTGLMPLSMGMEIIIAGPAGYRTPNIVKNLYKIIEHHRIATFSAVPTVYAALLQCSTDNIDLSSIKFAISGAAPIPVETFRKFQTQTGITLVEGYGLTEATCVSTLNPVGAEPRIGSIGISLPFSDVKVVVLDDMDNYVREAKAGEIGNLVTRGPNLFEGYMHEEHNTGIWITDHQGNRWFNTGDLGREDAEGYFWLTGRKKEIIIRGGHNIDPSMIEEAIAQHPAVDLVAAVGKPDTYAGELPVAYVTVDNTKGPVSEAVLLDFARDHIQEKAAIPKAIHIIEEMPLTAIGKIFKPQLNWWQIEAVIWEEINVSHLDTSQFAISVNKDITHGCIATISLKPNNPGNLTSIVKLLSARLDHYCFKYQICT